MVGHCIVWRLIAFDELDVVLGDLFNFSQLSPTVSSATSNPEVCYLGAAKLLRVVAPAYEKETEVTGKNTSTEEDEYSDEKAYMDSVFEFLAKERLETRALREEHCVGAVAEEALRDLIRHRDGGWVSGRG
jgi:hypothetical protein